MNWRVPLFKIYWDDNCLREVNEVIMSGMNWAVGSKVEEFEKAICEYIGVRYAVTFNSGTSALHALLLAYKIGLGDEVIVPSFTFIATANAALFVGAKPVFADIEEETLGLDPQDVNERVTEKTRAIIAVHYGGCPSKVKELREIADDHKIILIEDAAEAFGARIGSLKVGTFGDGSILSFCQNKVITTGEGGAVITNDEKIYRRLKLIRSHGRLESQEYFSSTQAGNYVELGYNWRLSNILAALGLAQIRKADKIIEMRREKAQILTRKLSKMNNIVPPRPPKEYFHVYQLYTIRVKNGLRDSLMKHLTKRGILSKIYFSPVHLTSFYREKMGFKGGELPVTEKVSSEVLSLPIYPTISDDEINYIVKSIKEFMGDRVEWNF
ncbi:MAG: DegT/DnrJ/EryC1/StrS family aminotransferase [archaeon GB-1845-036]|nr:DegT/DnrJ/EryC1/StrS family aminotransferase [Candidatus Culexmicrobium thermophilum]